MIGNLTYKTKLNLLLIASICLTFLILNRWIVTEIREKSFGRLWQYYVSWGDFGFFRRGFLGTILTETGLNSLFTNEYVFAYIFYAIMLLAAYFIVYQPLKKLEYLPSGLTLSFAILFSPALFAHFAYSTGSNDILLLLIFLLATFYANNIIVFSLLLIAGMLVHELFTFMLPSAIWFRYFLSDKNEKIKLNEMIFASVVSIVTIGLLFFYGAASIPVTDFDSIMQHRIPNAAYQHPLWSGHFEVSSSVASNNQFGVNSIACFKKNVWTLWIPTLYIISLALFCAVYAKDSIIKKFVLAVSLLFPVAAQIVAADYYRWVSMSGIMSLIFLLLVFEKYKEPIPKIFLSYLIIFSIFLPFGVDLNRPFPLHQFLLEKFDISYFFTDYLC
jgi:hypothetical protein